MSSFPSSYKEGNRIYWKIPECLPVDAKKVKKDFQLHNKSWQYVAYEYNSCGYLSIVIKPIRPCVCRPHQCACTLFKVRGGIIGDSQKELVAKNAAKNKIVGAKKESSYRLFALVRLSEIDLYMKSNEVLHMFIDMREVDPLEGESVEPSNVEPDSILDQETLCCETLCYEIYRVCSERDYLRSEKRIEKQQCSGVKNFFYKGKEKIEKDYENLLLSGADSDLTIKVKDKTFKCHRNILRVRSPVFSAMLKHDMKEKSSGVARVIDAEPTVFQEFLLYLYTGNSDHLDWKNVTDLYKLGAKYSVEDLKSLCVEQMKTHISTENFWELFLLSQQCNELELAESTVQFFLKKSNKIIDNENWLTFQSQNPVESNVLIKALAASKKETDA